MSETKVKAELMCLESCPDRGDHDLLKWVGDHTDHTIATVYDHDDAQGIVDAWNACQMNAVRSEGIAADEVAFRKNVSDFLSLLEAHKEQYNGSSAQKIFAEELCKLEGKLKAHINDFK